MNIVIDRDDLLAPLMKISGVVERRQTLPILANLLVNATKDALSITATDLEVEIKTTIGIASSGQLDFTLPARKLTDICKALPVGAKISFDIQGEKAVLRAGRSRFTLSTLPAQDYPAIEPNVASETFSVTESVLKGLIEKTQFAMAVQDVRYFLNGLLLERKNQRLRTIATDGHRLAVCEADLEGADQIDTQVILPRKAVLELGRLLENSDRNVRIAVSSNHVRVELKDSIFTTKLIDGRFPDYENVIPSSTNKVIRIDRELLHQALTRTSILSNEKFRGIRFRLEKGSLQLLAHNPEQEEAEEELEVEYEGSDLVVGFNVGYLIDVLSVLGSEQIEIEMSESNSSALIGSADARACRYVVMPMRL